MDRRIWVAGFLLLGLSACGNRAELEPKQGKSLPVAPYGREEPMTANELLEPMPQAEPERSVELRRRSEVREDDPFDLPPREEIPAPIDPAGTAQ